MKSYFAKLAARATVSYEPAPVASDATNVFDPFEQTALPETRSADTRSEKATPVMHERDVLSPSPPSPSPIPHQQENYTPIRKDETKDLSTKPPQAKSDSERVFEHAREPESGKPAKSEQEVIYSVKPSPVRILTPTPAGDVSNAAKVEANESGDESDQVRREQSMLLRKADDFMRKLFEDRSRLQSALSSDEDSEIEQPNVLKPNMQTTQAPRLHPTQPAERMLERDSDRPSLVIGKLTVEVTPPMPAPVMPRERVVVIRGPRGGRSGIPSSRRFGLGQF